MKDSINLISVENIENLATFHHSELLHKGLKIIHYRMYDVKSNNNSYINDVTTDKNNFEELAISMGIEIDSDDYLYDFHCFSGILNRVSLTIKSKL